MSFYTSLTGLNSATKQLAVTSNNIANVGTSGFKRSRADFGDIFSTSPLQKSSSQIGQGVSLKQVSQEFSQGNVSTSGNSLDLAITGDGFFPLKSADGLQDVYTRNGAFTLNDQNNVVNASGQRLQAASVDSSGKADLSALSALTIPPQTTGEAVETTNIKLGLNLPAESDVITAEFDRNDPSTFNKSTALTVYDSGGNGYLATVYYVKTQNASLDSPQSKWQTYFFVGATEVTPALQQASDKSGSMLYVNKYGDVLPKSDPRVVPPTGTTEMYTLDELSNVQTSSSASVTGATVNTLAGAYASSGTSVLELDVDDGSVSRTLTYTLTDADRFPEALAKNLEVAINSKLALSTADSPNEVSVKWDAAAKNFKFTNVTGSTSIDTNAGAVAFDDAVTAAYASAYLGREQFAEMSVTIDGTTATYKVDPRTDSDPEVLATNLKTAINAALATASSDFTATVAYNEATGAYDVTYADDTTTGSASVSAPAGSASVTIGSATTTYTFDPATDGDTSVLAQNLQAKINDDLSNAGEGYTATVSYNTTTRAFDISATGGVTPVPATVANAALNPTATFNDVLEFSLEIDGGAAQRVSYALTDSDVNDPEVLAKNLEIAINNHYGSLDTLEARYGIQVSYNSEAKTFSFSSGKTGDASSIRVTASSNATREATAKDYLGLDVNDAALTLDEPEVTDTAARGKLSSAAELIGQAMTINTQDTVEVKSGNNTFFVAIDGISATVKLPITKYTMPEFAAKLQEQINSVVDPDTGRRVQGVKVEFDDATKKLTFVTGTTGDNASIQVTGSADWGLAESEIQFGETTNWILLEQYKENGALQYVRNGAQTEDSTDLATSTEWWPVFLDRGELSFDLAGKPVSPLQAMPYETAFLEGGKGALTLGIDFTQSTQYSSPFAVLSQSQDGAPEGDLMGLDIGVDGLVSATYSNGTQAQLGKIVLANFSSPTGLRQVGDASYLASATSGSAKIGEAGSAGYGQIRAGATERANVDLTQELVDLITAQRNFQANAKAIETSSTMTQAIINMRS